MDMLFYAVVMGFVMAAPFGVIGAAVAMAGIMRRARPLAQLLAGVLVADALVIFTINLVLVLVPSFGWAQVKQWAPVWWLMIAALTLYGLYLLLGPPKASKRLLYPAHPFWHAVGFTLFANPKNWLGTFAAYAGWQVLGLLPTTQVKLQVGVAAWLGGILSWLIWAFLCWHAQRYHLQAQAIAQRLLAFLCLFAAASASYTLLAA